MCWKVERIAWKNPIIPYPDSPAMNIFLICFIIILVCTHIHMHADLSESFKDKLQTSHHFASKTFSEYLIPKDKDMFCVTQCSGQLQDANIEASQCLQQGPCSRCHWTHLCPESRFFSPAQDHICKVTFDQIKIFFIFYLVIWCAGTYCLWSISTFT